MSNAPTTSSKHSVVLRQSAWQVAYRSLNVLTIIAATAVCAYFTSHETFALYGLLILLVGAVVVFMEAGLGPTALAFLSANPTAAGGITRLRFRSVSIVAGVASLSVPPLWLMSPHISAAVFCAILAAYMLGVGNALITDAQAQMRNEVLATAALVGQTVGFAVSTAAIIAHPSLTVVLLSQPLLYAIRGLITVGYLHRADLLAWGRLSKVDAKTVRRASVPLTAWSVIGVLHLRFGALAAYLVLGVTASAPLALPQRVLEIAPIIPTALMTVALPSLVRSLRANEERYRVVREQLLQVVCLVGLLLGNLINFAAPWLTSALGGQTYPHGVLLFRVASLTSVFIGLNLLLVTLLIVQGQQSQAFKRGAASMVLSAALCAAMTVRFGLVGAAWATIVAEIALTALLGCVVWQGGSRPQATLTRLCLAVTMISYAGAVLVRPESWVASGVAAGVWVLALPVLYRPTRSLVSAVLNRPASDPQPSTLLMQIPHSRSEAPVDAASRVMVGASGDRR